MMGNWAAGSLAIGLGIIPLVVGIAALFRAPGETPSRELRMFRCVALAGLLSFGMYTGMKAAYLSTVFETRVEERNLIYIAPLLFVGTALVLERRRFDHRALFAAGAYALYLVGYAAYHSTQSPYEMGVRLYSDALGFAIAQQANLVLYLTPQRRAPAADPRARRRDASSCSHPVCSRAATRLVAALTVTLGDRDRRLEPNRRDLRGGEHELHRTPVRRIAGTPVLVGRRRRARTADALLRPGRERPDGRVDARVLEQVDRQRDEPRRHDSRARAGGRAERRRGRHALLDSRSGRPRPPVRLRRRERSRASTSRARRVGTHSYLAADHIRVWSLVRLAHPNRLRAECTGISPDGWTGPARTAPTTASRADRAAGSASTSRAGTGAGRRRRAPCTSSSGRSARSTAQPALGEGHAADRPDRRERPDPRPVWVRAPGPRFAVRVVVDDKFVPCQVEPTVSRDCRQLGAEVSYRFFRSAAEREAAHRTVKRKRRTSRGERPAPLEPRAAARGALPAGRASAGRRTAGRRAGRSRRRRGRRARLRAGTAAGSGRTRASSPCSRRCARTVRAGRARSRSPGRSSVACTGCGGS